MASLQQDLDDLLQELFADADELSRFLAYVEVEGSPVGEGLVKKLPGRTVSIETYSFEAAGALARRNLVGPALVHALKAEFSQQIEMIDAFSQRLPVSAPRASIALQPPPPPVDRPFAPFARFVGRQSELTELQQRLRAGRSTLLIGGCRTGKTALVLQLTREALGRRLFCVDIAGAKPETEAEFIAALGAHLGTPCTSRDALEAVLRQQAPLALVIDEADRLLGRPWAGNFLAWLRRLDDTVFGHHFAFLLVGGPELSQYRHDDGRGSPPLNTTDPLYLKPLDRPARRSLIAELNHPLDEAILFTACGGHPWLLQRTLDQLQQGVSLKTALNHISRIGQPHFETWRRQMGKDALELLQCIPEDGFPLSAFDYDSDSEWKDWEQEYLLLRCLCLIDEWDGRVFRGPMLAMNWLLRERK